VKVNLSTGRALPKAIDAATHQERVMAAFQRLANAKHAAAEVEETWRHCRDELESARAEIEYLATVRVADGGAQ
jgi:hypothetical protein